MEVFLIILVIVVAIGFVFLIVNISKTTSFEDRDKNEIEKAGELGESEVSIRLSEIASKYNGYLINRLIFEDKYNKKYSTDIDHILITRGGVFVIETKNYSGIVVGKEDEDEWVCLKKGNRKNEVFRNPIKQNQLHIRNLKKVFNVNPPKMTSVVIFVRTDITSIVSNCVYNLDEAIGAIERSTIEGKYSKEFVERIYAQILYIKNNYSISREKHIENIKRNHKN